MDVVIDRITVTAHSEAVKYKHSNDNTKYSGDLTDVVLDRVLVKLLKFQRPFFLYL